MGSKSSSGSSLHIPVIDISEASEAETANQLVTAVAQSGFVFIKGEDVRFTRQILDDTFALVRPKQLLDRQSNLMIWVVREILLVIHRRKKELRYQSQCKYPSAGTLPGMKPASHILLEHRLVLNAFRNLGPEDPEGT